MERIPNAVYTKELREEAVKLVMDQGLTIPEVGRRLSIPKSTISYWVREAKKGNLSSVGSSKKALTAVEMELAQVKRELARTKMERDFLRKAAAYFAKEPQSGTR
jgi:transposase